MSTHQTWTIQNAAGLSGSYRYIHLLQSVLITTIEEVVLMLQYTEEQAYKVPHSTQHMCNTAGRSHSIKYTTIRQTSSRPQLELTVDSPVCS